MLKGWVSLCAVLELSLACLGGEAPEAAEPEKPAPKPAAPPLPLLSLEGFSGVYLTDTALLANAPAGDSPIGKPCFAFSAVKIGHKDLESFSATINVLKRIEFGYSFQRLGLGDFPHDVKKATGISIAHASHLHTVGVRAMILRDGEGGHAWVPAVTIGARYKKNTRTDDINDDLGGVLKALGYKDDDTVEFTLMASKVFAGILPKPFILSAGFRNTDAIHGGFVGFSNNRHTLFEGNAIFFITDRLVLAGEYRQMPGDLKTLGKLVRKEDDWWSLAFAYVFNENLTGTLGFAHLGRVLNHKESFCPLAQLKWEF